MNYITVKYRRRRGMSRDAEFFHHPVCGVNYACPLFYCGVYYGCD